jgi:hypothetical protein
LFSIWRLYKGNKGSSLLVRVPVLLGAGPSPRSRPICPT